MLEGSYLVYAADGQFLGRFDDLMDEHTLDVCDYVYATTEVGAKLILHDTRRHKAWMCTVLSKSPTPNDSLGMYLGERSILNVLGISRDSEVLEMELEYLVPSQSWVHRIADRFHIGKDPERARFWAYYVVPTGIVGVVFALFGVVLIVVSLLSY